MTDQFLGEVRAFTFSFPPNGWAECNGQILPISQNTALFALLGTMYGGNGQTTFALPDLQGRAAIGRGQGPGLSEYDQGQQGGETTVTLLASEMPSHSHAPQVVSQQGDRRDPFAIEQPRVGHRWAGSAHNQYSTGAANASMDPTLIGSWGTGSPHPNESPYLVLRYCIALEGVFPPRN